MTLPNRPPNPICPKCGDTMGGPRYYLEALNYRCACGYSTRRPPLDAKPEEKP